MSERLADIDDICKKMKLLQSLQNSEVSTGHAKALDRIRKGWWICCQDFQMVPGAKSSRLLTPRAHLKEELAELLGAHRSAPRRFGVFSGWAHVSSHAFYQRLLLLMFLRPTLQLAYRGCNIVRTTLAESPTRAQPYELHRALQSSMYLTSL